MVEIERVRGERIDVAKLRWRIEHDCGELKDALGLDHFEGRTYRGLEPPRLPGLGSPQLPHPGAPPPPSSQGGGLSLFALLHELHALIACWSGSCPICRRRLPLATP